MKIKSVPNRWIYEDGLRLDCGPYMSGAMEARKILEDLSVPKQELRELTAGHDGGIYNGPQFRRTYVDSKDYGVPFLGSSSVLAADLSNLPLLSNKDAHSAKLSHLKLSEGTTLITCSGTIGRMAYARSEMEGMWTSQHVLKVVPDRSKILPGYLYAYLSSKFGVPLVTSGTYGAIIQHIEPHHIAQLPVPRLASTTEKEIHILVNEAAVLRAEASKKKAEVIIRTESRLNWNQLGLHSLSNTVSSSKLNRRFDGFYHSLSIDLARTSLSSTPKTTFLGKITREIFEPNRGARVKADSALHGVPFLSSSEVFRLDPTGEYFISKKMPHYERFLIEESDLLLPRSGQIGGIIGHAVLPLPTNYGHAASDHLVRIRCHTCEQAYYLWAIFATQPGYYAAIGTAFGTSIPSLDCELLSQLEIPLFEEDFRQDIVMAVTQMVSNLTEAIRKERAATKILENSIELLEAA